MDPTIVPKDNVIPPNPLSNAKVSFDTRDFGQLLESYNN
jgi:hypothetical protein